MNLILESNRVSYVVRKLPNHLFGQDDTLMKILKRPLGEVVRRAYEFLEVHKQLGQQMLSGRDKHIDTIVNDLSVFSMQFKQLCWHITFSGRSCITIKFRFDPQQ